MYVPALVFIHFAQCPTKHANLHAVQYFLQFGYTVKSLQMHDIVTSIIKISAEELRKIITLRNLKSGAKASTLSQVPNSVISS